MHIIYEKDLFTREGKFLNQDAVDGLDQANPEGI